MTQLTSLVAALALFATPPLPSQVAPTAPPSSDTCIASVRDVSHSSYSARNDRHEVEWRSDGCDVTISFDGDPRFTEDFRTLQSLGPRRIFRHRRTEPPPETRARDSAAGRRARIPVSINGQRRDFDAEGRQWLDTVIREFFRRTAYASKARVAWLFRNGGANRVLDEIDQMPSAYPQQAYMSALINQEPPTRATVDRMLQRARAWSSDYYKSGLLKRLVEVRTPEAGTWEGLWAVALTIDSDYYSAQVVRAYMDAGGPLNAAQFGEVLRKINSDYYRAGMVDVGERKMGSDYGPIVLAAARQTEVGVLPLARSSHGICEAGILTPPRWSMSSSSPASSTAITTVRRSCSRSRAAVRSKERHATPTSAWLNRSGHGTIASAPWQPSMEPPAEHHRDVFVNKG